MRKLKHISPSSLSMFYRIREDIYKAYHSDTYVPRDPGTKPMLLGSSFDAFVKNELVRCLRGGKHVKFGEPFHLETLFNAQVEKGEYKTWAWETGGGLFLKYKDSGAFDQLLIDMEGANDVQFEHKVFGDLTLPSGTKVTIKGFVDLCYKKPDGTLVVVDWKCNNHCAKNKQSPKPHYVIRRPKNTAHPKGSDVCFSKIDKKWAEQLCIYTWMLGTPIGESSPIQIEQLLGVPVLGIPGGDCEIVTYRSNVGEAFQYEIVNKIQKMHDIIDSGHIFDKLDKEGSDKRCAHMERLCQSLVSNEEMWKVVKGRE